MKSPEVYQRVLETRSVKETERKPLQLEIGTFKPVHLIPILEAFYGKKNWHEKSDYYWRMQEWVFQPAKDIDKNRWSPEAKKYFNFLKTIIKWSVDEETRGHLDPAPGIPVYNQNGEAIAHVSPDLSRPRELDIAIADLAKYYFNKGEPHKIKSLLAFEKNKKGEQQLLAALTLRWRGDKYIPQGRQKVASIERLIVDPKKRQQGVGLVLASSAIEYAFNKHKGYKGKGAEEIRAWVMADRIANNYQINMNFFLNKLGFRVLSSPYASWKEYARIIGEKTDRNALWLSLKKEDWRRQKKRRQL